MTRHVSPEILASFKDALGNVREAPADTVAAIESAMGTPPPNVETAVMVVRHGQERALPAGAELELEDGTLLGADVVISLNLKFSKIETVEMSAVRAEVIERAALRNRDIAALIAVSELFLDRLHTIIAVPATLLRKRLVEVIVQYFPAAGAALAVEHHLLEFLVFLLGRDAMPKSQTHRALCA